MESNLLVDEIIDHAATSMYTFQTFIYVLCVCNIHLLLIELLRTANEANLIWRWYSHNHRISLWKEAFKVQRCRATFMIHTWLNSAVCEYMGKHMEHVNFGLHDAAFCLALVDDTMSYNFTH